MATSSGNICILFITILFLGLTGCSGTRPDSFLDEENNKLREDRLCIVFKVHSSAGCIINFVAWKFQFSKRWNSSFFLKP